jgi:hypothetical protein
MGWREVVAMLYGIVLAYGTAIVFGSLWISCLACIAGAYAMHWLMSKH